MEAYIHRVAYYETDRMGITHHSNYIRWMEEARVDFMDQIGWNFARMEAEGITSPVLGVECRYRKPTTFEDRVAVEVTLPEYNGIRSTFGYTMRKLDADGTPGHVVFTGTSQHCFVGPDGRPMRVDRELSAFDAALREVMARQEKAGQGA